MKRTGQGLMSVLLAALMTAGCAMRQRRYGRVYR
jgi:hypothetical protein